uniref:Uncharacterized protein n=1 Tax=Glossina pallidipes TaxID=7398 RepID=A0A1A9Z7W8_GLOPL
MKASEEYELRGVSVRVPVACVEAGEEAGVSIEAEAGEMFALPDELIGWTVIIFCFSCCCSCKGNEWAVILLLLLLILWVDCKRLCCVCCCD